MTTTNTAAIAAAKCTAERDGRRCVYHDGHEFRGTAPLHFHRDVGFWGENPDVEPTLDEVLRSLGYVHRPRANPSAQGRAVYRGFDLVWEGTATECWAWLRATGQLASR